MYKLRAKVFFTPVLVVAFFSIHNSEIMGNTRGK